ncbi:hypothetical protein RNAN_0859 [Rheinheimera nanhaiensis E407-8]|uniref:Uncharacterized protein n=1 Tax=Rheinheimera nanhaiensis E407-8 TaxID=562729 RepID=I1DV11_9GAMM|nr:hypothetical protein RNAN_0859 [Rheinheimera nanhaiensis E407-8]
MATCRGLMETTASMYSIFAAYALNLTVIFHLFAAVVRP